MNTVIFACVHNAGRSQMSAAFFNALADPESALGAALEYRFPTGDMAGHALGNVLIAIQPPRGDGTSLFTPSWGACRTAASPGSSRPTPPCSICRTG